MLQDFMFFHRVRVESTKWRLPRGGIGGSGLILRISRGIISAALHLALIPSFTHLAEMDSGISMER